MKEWCIIKSQCTCIWFLFFYQKYFLASMIAVYNKDIFVKYCFNVITYTWLTHHLYNILLLLQSSLALSIQNIWTMNKVFRLLIRWNTTFHEFVILQSCTICKKGGTTFNVLQIVPKSAQFTPVELHKQPFAASQYSPGEQSHNLLHCWPKYPGGQGEEQFEPVKPKSHSA